MKKKDIDFFGILLGLIIGCVLGYFIFIQFNNSSSIEEEQVKGSSSTEVYGNVYLLQVAKSSVLDSVKQEQNRLAVLNFHSEVILIDQTYYLYCYIASSLEEAQTKKAVFESYGFNVTVKSDYIADLAMNSITDSEKYAFYSDAIAILIKSLNKTSFTIEEKYYSSPVDIEVFSNLTMLYSLKNETIKEQFQLNTYRLLVEKLK